MQTIEVYSVTENTDKTEGRGPRKDVGIYFLKEEDALKFVSSKKHYGKYAVMGFVDEKRPYGNNIERKIFEIFDSIEDYEKDGISAANERKRLNALEKLTQEEKELLGLE